MDTFARMQAFVKVAEAGGFSAAARNMGRSKALLSKQVKDLEDELGVRLLNRTTRRLSVTEAGGHYLREATEILRRVDDLKTEVSDTGRTLRGRLRVSLPRGVGDDDIVPALMAFAARHPDIVLDIMQEDRFVDLIEEGVDLAIRVTEPADSSLIARRLCPYPFAICASPDLIAQVGIPDRPRDLASFPCIIDTNYRFLTQWVFYEDGNRQSVKVDGRVAVNSLAASRSAALAGLGFARVPLSLVRSDLDAGRLVRVLEGTEGINLGVFALYADKRHVSAKLRSLIDFLVSFFTD
ncbi:MAG: LysR family transcriptional regulator [Pseudomonadota bacterium]